MKNRHFLTAVFFCAATLSVLHAGDDLWINGDFTNYRGSSQPIPDWTIERGKAARIRMDKDDFGVELEANAKIVSKLCAVRSDKIKLEAEVRGSGMGRLSYAVFDKDGKPIDFRRDGIRFSAQNRKSEIKAHLDIPPQAAFVAVTLETGVNSKIIFEDVEAEFVPPFRKTVPQENTIPLTDDRYYRFSDLTALPFSVTLKPGEDIDFELENTPGGHWSTKSGVDGNFLLIKSGPKTDGIWPFRRYKTEFEIKAIRRGKTDIVFTHTNGTRFVVKITVKK